MSKKNRKTCKICEKEMALSNFYSTSSPFFPDGKMDVCRKCSIEIVEEEGFQGFQDLMKIINKPIYQEMYKNNPGDYVRQMNSLPQYRGVTYEDSTLFNEVKDMSSMVRNKPTEMSEEELRNAEDFWGLGENLSEKDYIWLNYEYEDYTNRYHVDSKVLENLIRQICLVEFDIKEARSNGRDVDKMLKSLNELLGAANLRPNQESGNMSVDQESFGTLLRQLENDRPVPDPAPEWQDVDGISRYIKTFFLGHMAKMFGKKNPYQDIYDEEIGKYTVVPPDERDNIE